MNNTRGRCAHLKMVLMKTFFCATSKVGWSLACLLGFKRRPENCSPASEPTTHIASTMIVKFFVMIGQKIHSVSLNFEMMKLKLICEQAAFRNVHVERLKIRLNWNSSMHTLYYFSTSLAGDTLQSGKKIMIRPQNSAYNLYENPSWVQILKQIIWNLPESQSLSGCKSHAVGGR